ncbi:hypothetical protein MASR2M70_19790 [Bacillota bacterium]
MINEAYEHVRYFVEECGHRYAGSPEVLKASDYIAEQFENYGLEVERQDFQLPICEIKSSEVKVKIDGQWQVLSHTPALYSRGTPSEGISLPLVYCEDGSVYNLENNDIRGKAVLICRDSYIEYPDIKMYKRLYEYGVKAVFYTSSDGHRDIPFVYANCEHIDEPYTIPTAILSYHDAMELAKKENIEIFYTYQYEIEDRTVRNTIGSIQGSDPSMGNVLVCAHLDCAISSLGATDDLGGVAMVLVMAKIYGEMKKKGIVPKRTIYFVAWSGHEPGLYGSKNFILQKPAVCNDMKFIFNYDILGNALSSPQIWAGCNEEVEAELNAIVSACKLDWRIDIGPWVVDTISFAGFKIPHITLSSGFYAINHTKYDNLSFISSKSFITPIHFSKVMLEWAANKEEISQGYPEYLYESMKEYGDMYGWGFFD